jgi:hypothetical protein
MIERKPIIEQVEEEKFAAFRTPVRKGLKRGSKRGFPLNKEKAVWLAVKGVGQKEVSEKLNVNFSQVRHWFVEPDFKKKVEEYSQEVVSRFLIRLEEMSGASAYGKFASELPDRKSLDLELHEEPEKALNKLVNLRPKIEELKETLQKLPPSEERIAQFGRARDYGGKLVARIIEAIFQRFNETHSLDFLTFAYMVLTKNFIALGDDARILFDYYFLVYGHRAIDTCFRTFTLIQKNTEKQKEDIAKEISNLLNSQEFVIQKFGIDLGIVDSDIKFNPVKVAIMKRFEK